MTCKHCSYNNEDEPDKPHCDHVSANEKQAYPNALNCNGFAKPVIIQANSYYEQLFRVTSRS